MKPRNAFEELAPSSSTSGRSTMPVKKVPYDVFINHRGPDVKKGLATDLYNTLNGMGLRVFLDSEELELGDSFPREIEEAISSASVQIAIFSESYAQSPWCLAELSFMLKTGTKIVPVFYHVQIDDVRYAKGVYAAAFCRYKEKGRHTPEKLQEWKDALRSVPSNGCYIINTKEDETKLLKNIANYTVKEIKNIPLVVAQHPVGLDEALHDFEMTALQSDKGHSTVQVVGICGMGGVGKTTLAKEIYNTKCRTMERHSFLFDVRDAAHRSVLHIKQKKLLEDLGFRDEKVNNVEEGKGILARYFRSVRVLIVLDDVDNVEQLDALVPAKDNLRLGSLVVVTTRQIDVLRRWGISSSSIYKMEGLNPSYSEQLFCWHAFLQPFPKDGFAELVKQFINACHGLPLSLKVFGAQLYGKSDEDYWKSQLEKIRRILDSDIIESLKVSYDALYNEEKEAFLDAACFFIGEEKGLAIEVWNATEGSGLCSWETLVNRCLVEVDDMDCIRIHDHLRDMGREISFQQSPHRLLFRNHTIGVENQTGVRRAIPDLLSTLCSCFPWHIITNVEKQVEKRIDIRGIMATSTRLEWVPGATEDKQFRYRRMVVPDGSTPEDMKVLFNTGEGIWTLSPSLAGLKFIVARGHNINQVIDKASRELVWLRWLHVGEENLPLQLSLKDLRVLEIYGDDYEDHPLQELWKDGSNAPTQLRELVISGCYAFQRFPDSIGSLKHLKKIVVEQNTYEDDWDYELKSLPRDFCLLQSLEHLKLYCQLSSLPDNFGDLKNLRYLYLTGCQNLRRLPVSFKDLTLLQHLHLQGFLELTLESEIMKEMRKLEYFNLYDCRKLQELPRHITDQPSLTELQLSTESLKEVPVNIGQLSRLRKLRITSKMLTSLPASLGDLSSLTELRLQECPELESLPDSVGRLSKLEYLSVISLGVKSLPESVNKLINLQTLLIRGCPIKQLDLGTGLFTCSLCNLKRIELESTQVCKISISEDCCSGLEILSIRNNSHLTDIEVLPTTVKSINLENCKMLRNIRVIDSLVNIQKLKIFGCPKLDALPSVALFASLQEFELNGCDRFQEIQGLQHWTALEKSTAERLRGLQLIAIRRSVVEPYIQTMKKWPEEEIVVSVRALPGAASLVKSFPFRTLAVSIVASSDNQIIDDEHWCKLVQTRSPSGDDAIIVCFVINCVTPRMLLELFTLPYAYTISKAELEDGKWVWLAIFTQRSSWLRWNKYGIGRYDGYDLHEGGAGIGVVERAVVGVGEHSRVVETFSQLWGLLPERML